MSASLDLHGVDELREALLSRPEELSRNELGPIVESTAAGLVSELKATYAKVDGVLAERVVSEPGRSSPLLVKVRSKAPHAHLYEYGTVRRFTKGSGAARGTMPAQPTFVPAAVRWRDRMIRQVKGALGRLQVPGFTGSFEVRET